MFWEHLNMILTLLARWICSRIYELTTDRDHQACPKSGKYHTQIARHRNHLVFNLRCKGECVIPPSLRLKCPINSDKARNIVEKARKNLLQKRIRLTNQKISNLQDKKRRLAERFPSDVQQQLNARLTRVHESVRKQAKCRQQDKLASLISKSVKNKHSEPEDPPAELLPMSTTNQP